MRLVADKLAGERGGDILFSGIDFVLGPGECLVVTGPNGSGKSTLLRIVAGLLRAAEGEARLEDGGEEWPTLMSACHYLGHQNAMKPVLTVGENLRFWTSFLGSQRHSPDEALEAVGLSGIGHLPWGYLSTGQKRRTAIARLLASHRPVWLLDEPTAGLDSDSDAMFAGLLKAHLAEGGIAVAATHMVLGVQGVKSLRMEQVGPK
jgi:heme exporter protein A